MGLLSASSFPSRHRFCRTVLDSHAHALRLSGSHSRQRFCSCVPSIPIFSFRFHRHTRLQQSNSQSEAIQLAFLTFLRAFSSRYIFHARPCPPSLLISYFIPASYYINITRGIILRGAGLTHLWLDGLAFMPWAPFFFSSPPAASKTRSSWLEVFHS